MHLARKHLLEEPAANGRHTKRQAQGQIGSLPERDSSKSNSPSTDSPTSVNYVCFGMILGVKTQFLDDPRIAALQPGADQPTCKFHPVRIVLKRIHLLQTNDGRDVAVLNNSTSKVLSELDRRGLVSYDVYVAADEWATQIRTFMTQGKSTCLDVSINFFGSPSNGTAVGRILSDTRHFLQPPDVLDNAIPYKNPHEFVFPSTGELESSLLPSNSTSVSLNDLPRDIDTVLSNLDHADSLVVREVDEYLLMTELKLHQKEALDFIVNREATHTSNQFSIFQRRIGSHNRTYYEHSVVGCRRSEKPPENCGGILADEMGLGKTLTMISAIATTKKQASQFQIQSDNDQEIPHTMKRSRATLVICPAVLLMDGWMEEVSKHVAPDFLKCIRYHGASKATTADMLDSDIVLTTYATLIADSSRDSLLHSIYWFRVILDEAHSIRNQRTRQFRAVVALSARYRWCLTGTPIQNTLNDLASLVRFLRVPQLDGLSDFYNHIVGPIERHNMEGLRRLRHLLQCICLRRTKDLLNLPEPDSRVESVHLSTEEKDQYHRIGEVHRQEIDEAIKCGNLSDASSGLLRAILRLRLFCNSGLCVDSKHIDADDEESSPLQLDDQAVCSYCSCDVGFIDDRESVSSGMMLSCSHLLCRECVDRSENPSLDHIRCIVCETICLASIIIQNRSPLREKSPLRLTGYSSKLEALAHNVNEHRTEKCIVFSSWKKSIGFAAAYLSARDIPVCIVDGSMTLPQRRSVIQRFQQDTHVPALLMTLGTGAVGLNLTVANRVYILEPQWNPSIERQAIGRVMRLGQDRHVTIVRYVAEHTVEQHIQTRQQKKLHLAQLGWDDSKTNPDKELQRLVTMQSLLSIQQ